MAKLDLLPNGRIRVSFCSEELWILQKLAEARHLPKRQVGVPQNFVPPQGGIESDFLGLKGEYAAAFYLGVPFDTTINLAGDGGSFDLLLGKRTVQVKTTFYDTGRLVFNFESDFTADSAVLAYGEKQGTWIELLGWVDRQAFLDQCYHKDLGFGDRALLDQSKLMPMARLRTGREIEKLKAIISELQKTYPIP